jgi:hypothetical protein
LEKCNSPCKLKEIKWKVAERYMKTGLRRKITILISFLIILSIIGHYISFSLWDRILILYMIIYLNKYKTWYHLWKWLPIQKLDSLGQALEKSKVLKETMLELDSKCLFLYFISFILTPWIFIGEVWILMYFYFLWINLHLIINNNID